jgi:hypothetical protein
VAGVRIPPSALVLAPTPPPDVDVEAWERSLDVLAGWQPQRLVITHFGEAGDAQAQIDACREALHAEVALVAEHDEESFVALMDAKVRAEAPEVAGELAQAVPYDHIWKGLHRWHSKQGG